MLPEMDRSIQKVLPQKDRSKTQNATEEDRSKLFPLSVQEYERHMKSFGISVSTAGWKGPSATQSNSLNSAYSRTFLNQPHTKHLDVKQVLNRVKILYS